MNLRFALIAAAALSVAHQAGAADLSGVVVSHKTGAEARVSPVYVAKFQRYVDAIEAAGATVRFMGGYRRGKCRIPWSKHPCGMALDVCQYSRGVVDRRCHMPAEATLARIAESEGLLEGGVWCSSDRGHVEVRTSRQAEGCGTFARRHAAGRRMAAAAPAAATAPAYP